MTSPLDNTLGLGAEVWRVLDKCHRLRNQGEYERSLSTVGSKAGVSRARVQQIEQSDNIEIATLVRVAAACGYQVGISLEPLSPGMRAFSTVLRGATR